MSQSNSDNKGTNLNNSPRMASSSAGSSRNVSNKSNSSYSQMSQNTAAPLHQPPLPGNVVRLLQDKFYDKRKQAALEIEKWVLSFLI